MSKLTERQRLVLTIAVSVLITGGLVALILRDRAEIDEVNQEIASLDQRIRIADIEIRKTKSREDKVLVFRAVENRELAVLPTRQKIATFHRNLSTFLASAGLRFQELPESQPTESDLAKGIYVTRSPLSFQGDASSTLKFINMIENDPRLVAVKGLKIDAADTQREDPTAPVLHDCELHIETYYYNPSSDDRDRVHIPNAEARLQEEEIREAIASFQPERPDTYVLRPSASRRDPLVDPRERRQTLDSESLLEALRAQEAIVLDLETRLYDINEKYEQERALEQSGDHFRQDRLAQEVDDHLNELRGLLAQLDQRKSVSIPEMAVRVESVRARVEELRGRRPPRDLLVSRELSERTLREVQDHLAAGEYTEVATLTSQWQTFLEGRKIAPDAVAVVEEIASLRTRAKILSEFHSIPLRLSGTIVDPLDPTRSVALVNGRPMHIGDPLDGRRDALLKAIDRESVTFDYQGESIRVQRRDNEDEPRKPTDRRGSVHPVKGRR